MDHTASTESVKCPLLNLPPGLRLRIYEYIYDRDRRCSLVVRNNKQVECFQLPCFGCAGAVALLRTYKEIYHETRQFHTRELPSKSSSSVPSSLDSVHSLHASGGEIRPLLIAYAGEDAVRSVVVLKLVQLTIVILSRFLNTKVSNVDTLTLSSSSEFPLRV